MQFLWKYIDEMVGKGLEWYVIAELLIYASANLIPLALPMAVLLSSIMTFGNLGESYELVAMKSAGLSLIRIMKPLIIFTVFLSISAFFFSNHVWPKANLKFASLLYDIRHKKPAIDIQPGIFYRNIEGYVIRVGSKEKDGKTLYDVMIFDHVNTTENNKILYAEKGVMSFAGNDEYLELKLYNGYSYNEIRNKEALKNRNYPLMRTHFKEQIIRFDLTGFKLKRSNQELFKNNYQMLNLAQLERQMDTLKIQKQTIGKELLEKHSLKLNYFKDSLFYKPNLMQGQNAVSFTFDSLTAEQKRTVVKTAVTNARTLKIYAEAYHNRQQNFVKNYARHEIEWHRKFVLSIACLVLFFIGAPLGAIIRKGGLGMPVVISTLFFLFYHIISITGEKLAKQGEIPAWQGMWLATVILLPVGIFLTYKANTDSPIFEMDTYWKFLDKIKNFIAHIKHKKSTNLAG